MSGPRCDLCGILPAVLEDSDGLRLCLRCDREAEALAAVDALLEDEQSVVCRYGHGQSVVVTCLAAPGKPDPETLCDLCAARAPTPYPPEVTP